MPQIGVLEQRPEGVDVSTLPPCNRNPPGWFIQALTEITISDPVNPLITIGIPLNR